MKDLKALILAGGKGTRFAEETVLNPKPLIEVNGYPIITLIIDRLLQYKIENIYIATGYKKDKLNHYFKKIFPKKLKIKVKVYKKNNQEIIDYKKFKIILIDTGLETLTGGRIRYMNKFLNKNENFFCTYGDGISKVSLSKLFNFHIRHNKKVTLTAVRPQARFGRLNIKNKRITSFAEKSQLDEGRINGGFMIINQSALSLIKNYNTNFEYKILPILVKQKNLMAFEYDGYWKCMDTLRDKLIIEKDLINKIYSTKYVQF